MAARRTAQLHPPDLAGGLGPTFLLAGAILLATTLLEVWLPLRKTDVGDRTAVRTGGLPDVTVLGGAIPDNPVEVVVQYRVAPEHRDDFLRAITDLRTSRLRTGATDWLLLCDAVHEDRLVERFRVASWSDHRDQHERRSTAYDEEVRQRVVALAEDVSVATHLLIVTLPQHAVGTHHQPLHGRDRRWPHRHPVDLLRPRSR